MMEPLQECDFRKSQYERPNQKWVCGWAADGEPCSIGPDSRGQCQGRRECLPYKVGDSYRCARPPTRGGKCNDGPLSDGTCSQQVIYCQPVRSRMARRKLVAFSTAALALGVCLLMFGGHNDSLTSPGPLTLQHHSEVQTCAGCHSAADQSFPQWVTSTLGSGSHGDDSERCLHCHNQFGPQALEAHGVGWQQLRALAAATASQTGESSNGKAKPAAQPWVFSLAKLVPGLGHPAADKNRLSCAVCHHEHRGIDFDLTQMSNSQCQTCHSIRFASFRTGHPEFQGFPYSRRTRIRFDHATHYGTHFATYRRLSPDAHVPPSLTNTTAEGVPLTQSCEVCHQPDPAVKTMPVRGFEQSCAACHESRMQADTLPGIAYFVLPFLDANSDAFKTKHIPIGEWPAAEPSTKTVPPFMELLLRSDQKTAAVLDRIGKNGWSRLDRLKPDDVETLVWAVKELVYDIAQNGQPAMERRLRKTLGDGVSDAAGKSLCGDLATGPDFVDVLSKVQRRWFPNLALEIEARRHGGQAGFVVAAIRAWSAAQALTGVIDAGLTSSFGPWIGAPKTNVSSVSDRVDTGWYVDGAAIRYRVTGHADPFVRAWLDVSVDRCQVTGDSEIQPAEGRRLTTVNCQLSTLFRTLADRSQPFRCMDCHTADRQQNGRLRINWLAFHTSPGRQSFTRFSHAPHTMLLADENCAPCHRLDPEIRFFRTEFLRPHENWAVNTNPNSVRTSGFLPVSKETCAKCHVQRLAGDRCLKCHNYHVTVE